MRCVTTRVLPLPGPASTSSGPSTCRTASHCAGLSESNSGSTGFLSGATDCKLANGHPQFEICNGHWPIAITLSWYACPVSRANAIAPRGAGGEYAFCGNSPPEFCAENPWALLYSRQSFGCRIGSDTRACRCNDVSRFANLAFFVRGGIPVCRAFHLITRNWPTRG